MPKAVVLGAGMVGSVMAADLASDDSFDVAVVDRSDAALERAAKRSGGRITAINADLSNPESVKKLVEPADIVLGAVASVIGLQTLRAVIEAGKNFCDICFMPEDALELDALAKERGVTAVVDCGVAPGMSNMCAGFAAAELDECDSIDIYVGGLPRERRWPFEYKAGFSPYDVVEEYTRPARYVEQGRLVVREALSEPELMNFPGVGTLEAFNTDGLRTIATTMNAPCMKEKTLRYPGHIELMRVFRETGLFSHEPIDAGGVSVRPIDVISALMFPKWTYEPDEQDLTVMRIIVTGQRGGRRLRYTWDLLDFFDTKTSASSMSRTTAFPCAIMARLVANGAFKERGVMAPERVGEKPGMLERFIEELQSRGVIYSANVEEIDG